MDKLVDWIKTFLASLPIGSDGLKVVTRETEENLKKLIEKHEKSKEDKNLDV